MLKRELPQCAPAKSLVKKHSYRKEDKIFCVCLFLQDDTLRQAFFLALQSEQIHPIRLVTGIPIQKRSFLSGEFLN
jgi:hypothetical protein